VAATLDTLETEGQMLQRVMPDLMGMKNILVINDEATTATARSRAGDEGPEGRREKEAEKNNEAARSGSRASRRCSASWASARSSTCRRRRSSCAARATPRARCSRGRMSDFSLMDAIECGVVKLPRVPVAENIPGNEMPMFRDLWENIRKDMPKKGRGKGEDLDPLKLPTRLQTALEVLYGHYEKTFKLWQESGNQGAARFHCRLPEHGHLEAGLRFHFGLFSARTMTAPRRR
jgi:type III restriction enzyme